MATTRVWLAVIVWLVPTLVSAQEGFPLFSTDFPPAEFAARRAQIYKSIGSSGFALIQGAAAPAGYTRFRQSNEFYYLCGIEVPHAYLLLDGATSRATLYLPHRNERREQSEGKVLAAEDAVEIVKASGVDAVFGVDVLAEHLARGAFQRAGRTLYTPHSPAEGTAMSRDLAVRAVADRAADPFDGTPSREGVLVKSIRERFPQFEIRNLTPLLDEQRRIKSAREITLIKKATRLSGLALLEAMRSTEPGLYEYELDAAAKYVFYRNGAQGDAYYSLIASGTNAWFPHYNAGKRQMRDGDFLLMDYAPDVGYYMSDVTRMMPVNGRFSAQQRELYGFYLGCYNAVLDAIEPRLTAQTIVQRALPTMERLLQTTTFSKATYKDAAQRFVAEYQQSARRADARLGHWVGMATHDVGSYDGPLQPGMVFTIEPALTVPEERIYVRLEDLIIITESGKEIASDFVPRDVDAIERVMREEGILQRYPRDAARR